MLVVRAKRSTAPVGPEELQLRHQRDACRPDADVTTVDTPGAEENRCAGPIHGSRCSSAAPVTQGPPRAMVIAARDVTRAGVERYA